LFEGQGLDLLEFLATLVSGPQDGRTYDRDFDNYCYFPCSYHCWLFWRIINDTRERGEYRSIGEVPRQEGLLARRWFVQGVGVAVGGALGLGAGALIGDQLQGQEIRQADQQQQVDLDQAELDRQRRDIERLKKQSEY